MTHWLTYPENEAALAALMAANLSPLLARLLVNRGITTAERAEIFLRPKLSGLKDPFEIPQLEAATKRAWLAKERGEKVVVYGDYDVDGVTATTILMATLRFLGFDATYYIPNRYGEGYSLSIDSVNKLAAAGAKLIITVDCGISSAREIEAAKALGMEVIVTDHHNLPRQLPTAAAGVVNPKMIVGEHPSKYLSGAGVAFKFAWGLLRAAGFKDSVFLTSLLDLAALGTFSDVVTLTDENRLLAVGGLNLINERRRPGLKQLGEIAGLRQKVAAEQVYFGLAPRLNAAGRLEHASKAVELLLASDEAAAKIMAEELDRINVRRQKLGAEIKEEVFARIDPAFLADNPLILLSGDKWHPGVIGIVASQVAETFGRPTVLIGINEGMGRGSARSVEGVNIFLLLDACRDLFLDFGGHEGAAGFAIIPENIPRLRERLMAAVKEQVDPAALELKLYIDAELKPAEISLGLIKELDRLAPFGEGNEAPIFQINGLPLTEFKLVGKNGRHLKAWFDLDGVRVETIGFGFASSGEKLVVGHKYDLAVNLGTNEFNGFEKAQLSLVDLRPA
jgi:single-stranded-DNA-specific exonuclease